VTEPTDVEVTGPALEVDDLPVVFPARSGNRAARAVDGVHLAVDRGEMLALVGESYLGRIVEIGTTEDVLERPQHPYTRALLSVVPEITHVEPVVLAGEPPDPTRIPGGCRFHPRCPALALGAAHTAGVDTRCHSEQPPVLPPTGGHRAACFLTEP